MGVVMASRRRTTSYPESWLAQRNGRLDEKLAPLTLAYLPSPDGVDLRLTAWGLEQGEAEARLAAAIRRLRAIVGEDCYGEDGTDLAAAVPAAPAPGGHRLGQAESCPGGPDSHRPTSVPRA